MVKNMKTIEFINKADGSGVYVPTGRSLFRRLLELFHQYRF